MIRKLLPFLVLLCAFRACGQATQVATGPNNPATCLPTIGQIFFNNSTLPGTMLYCSGTNTWSAIGSGGGGSASWVTITGGTNNSQSFVCSTGCSFSASGSGTVSATSVPYTGISSFPANCASGQFYNSLSSGTCAAPSSGTGSPAGNAGDVQINSNSSPGLFAASAINDNGSLIAVKEDVEFKGPNPGADIRLFGASPLNGTTTASCTSGLPTITVGTVTNGPFSPGNTIYVQGCGAAYTSTTPPAPTVTSGSSMMQTVPDALIATATGSSTYSYILLSKDAFGGVSLPSSTTTITNGVTLGQQTDSVSSVTALGDTLTIVLSSNGPPNGTFFHLAYSANITTHAFDGYYNVCSGGGTTTITVCHTGFSSTATDSADSPQIVWFNANRLTWSNQTGASQQFVCGKRPGDSSFHFIGVVVPISPVGDTGPWNFWDDFGSSLMNSPTDNEITDSSCTAGSSTNDYLSATINSCTASCGTGSTWTLSANAGATVSGRKAAQDAGPALVAALTYIQTTIGSHAAITIPCTTGTGGYHVFTPTFLSTVGSWIEQCGTLTVHEPIDLHGLTQWFGQAPAELNSQPTPIYYYSYPALKNITTVRNIIFNSSCTNQCLALDLDALENSTLNLDGLQFSTNGTASISIMTVNGDAPPKGQITNTTLTNNLSGQVTDATWFPAVYLDSPTVTQNSNGANGHLLKWDRSYGFKTGIYANVAAFVADLDISHYYVQGAIQPMVGVFIQNTAFQLKATSWTSDTSSVVPIAVGYNINLNQTGSNYIRLTDVNANVSQVWSGYRPSSVYDFGNSISGQGTQQVQIAGVFPDNTSFGKLAIQKSSASDGFNRSNGSLGAPWVNQLNTVTITSNQVSGSGGGWNEAFYSSLFPNTAPNPTTGGEFCQVAIAAYGGQQAGCGVYIRDSVNLANGYVCTSDGSNLYIVVPNGTTLAGPTSYSGGGAGDQIYMQATATTGLNTALSCSVFPINGTALTITASNSAFFSGYPGLALFGTTSIEDAFVGGTLNPYVTPTTENYFQQPQHFTAITLGNSAPIAGSLGNGIYNSNWTPSAGICTDSNSKLVTTGCSAGTLSGMTSGQVAIAGSASSITSSKPLQGTDANVLSSGTVSGSAGTPLCLDGNSGATTTSCPTLSGLTTGQVAIAGSTVSVTSSKALQGTDTNVLSSGTVTGTGATLCTDANGGATTTGCTGGSISGLTTGQVPIAATATTLTSSVPLQGTDTSILTSGTVTGTGVFLCTDANGGATTTCNLSVYRTQSSAVATNIAATTMVASAPANTVYQYNWTISLTSAGTGCTGNTTVVLNVIFQDPSAAGSITESLGQVTLASGGVGTVGFVAQGVDTVYAKSGTAVQYSTSGYTPGAGCTGNPTYQVTMRLLPIS